MKISVAVCTHNRSTLLRQTLEGLAAQDYPAADWELLVVDNNSSDDTRAAVESFAAARPAPRWIPETRQGLDHARNRAVAEAAGSVIVFADDDILVGPDWLRRLAEPFAADTEGRVGCVGGEVEPVFPDGAPDWIRRGHSPLGFRAEAGPLRAEQVPMGANFAFRREVFARAGAFATALDRTGGKLFSGGDAEMVRRARAAGYEVWFAPAARVRHQMPAARTTFRYAARHAFDSARSRVVERAGLPGARAYLASRLLANLLRAPLLALWGLACAAALRPGAARRALVRAWRCCGYVYQIPRSLAGKI